MKYPNAPSSPKITHATSGMCSTELYQNPLFTSSPLLFPVLIVPPALAHTPHEPSGEATEPEEAAAGAYNIGDFS
jgi:hypothetical protein